MPALVAALVTTVETVVKTDVEVVLDVDVEEEVVDDVDVEVVEDTPALELVVCWDDDESVTSAQ